MVVAPHPSPLDGARSHASRTNLVSWSRSLFIAFTVVIFHRVRLALRSPPRDHRAPTAEDGLLLQVVECSGEAADALVYVGDC